MNLITHHIIINWVATNGVRKDLTERLLAGSVQGTLMLVHLSFRKDFNNDTYCNSGQFHYCDDVNDNPSGKARAATLHILDTSTRTGTGWYSTREGQDFGTFTYRSTVWLFKNKTLLMAQRI